MRARHQILSLLLVASASACGTDTITFEPLPDGGPLTDAGPARPLGGATLTMPDAITVTEGGDPRVLLSLWAIGASSDVTVTYELMPLTATPGADYTVPSPRTLVLPVVTPLRTIAIPIANDSLIEADEQFRVNLVSVTGAAISGSGSCLVTIRDDDTPRYALTAPDGTAAARTYEASRPHDGVPAIPNSVMLFIRRNNGPSVGSVRVRTQDGTAVGGLDYQAFDMVVPVSAGSVAQPVFIPILHDAIAEGPETFVVWISEPVGSPLSTPTAVTVTIAPPVISGCRVSRVAEPASGSTRFEFVITSDVPAPWRTRALVSVGGTAARALDYRLAGTSIFGVDIVSGEREARVAIDVLADSVFDPGETVTLTIIEAVGDQGAVLAPGCNVSTLTID